MPKTKMYFEFTLETNFFHFNQWTQSLNLNCIFFPDKHEGLVMQSSESNKLDMIITVKRNLVGKMFSPKAAAGASKLQEVVEALRR